MIIVVATATPASIKNNAAFGGLLAGMICVGIGTGGLKACIAPMCGEQNTEQGEKVTTLKSGEEVIVDGKLTSQRIFMWSGSPEDPHYYRGLIFVIGITGLQTSDPYHLSLRSPSRTPIPFGLRSWCHSCM